MNLEVSTFNVILSVVLTALLGFHAWVVVQLVQLRTQMAAIAAVCPYCRKRVKLAGAVLAAVFVVCALISLL